jgi:glycogen debranching enzyme
MELLNFDQSISLSTLEVLADYQGIKFNAVTAEQPGKILHEFQQDTELVKQRSKEVPWLAPGKNYFSVDSTPLYLILLHQYIQRYGKPSPAKKILGAAGKALTWIIDFGIKGNFLSYAKAGKGLGLQSQSWRDGIGSILDIMKDPIATVGVQGYAYLSLLIGRNMVKDSIDEDRYSALVERIDSVSRGIKDHIVDYFFLDETGYFALAVDGDGVAERTATSDPGHLLMSGILSRKTERLVIDRLFEEDMLTDYGIRSMSSESQYFDEKAYQRGSVWPQDNFMICLGLDMRGYRKESREIKERISLAMDELKGFPEYFGVSKNGDIIQKTSMRIAPCDPQAWSVGAYYYAQSEQ